MEAALLLKVDMDKLADGLQKLGEDDLLKVVQMVHDNKSAESYTKNDVERMSLGPPRAFLRFYGETIMILSGHVIFC
jgi:hypothetical protein